MPDNKILKNPANKKKTGDNRRTSAGSTGPRTPEGKQKVSRNAVKHGLLSKEVVIKSGDGKENPREFKQLMERFQHDLQPVGVLEEMLVERIVVCYWRLRRALRCETGKIRARLDNASYRELLGRKDSATLQLKLAYISERKEAFRQSSLGVRHLLGLLDQVEGELENGGSFTSETQKCVSLCFGKSVSNLADLCVSYDPAGGRQLAEEDKRVQKADLLEAVDWERTGLEDLLESWREVEEKALDARMLSLSLPDDDSVDKIARYETTIERQLYKAIAQLEALQKRRNGE